MRIDDACLRPEANNLTIVRLLLAASVIYSHCWTVGAGADGDNLTWLLGATVSTYGVDGFFMLSGFLVYRSLATSGSVRKFTVARLTRLWPGLAAMIALVVLVGLFVTQASPAAYLTGRDTLRFVGLNLSLAWPHFTLTGVTCGGEPCVVNGSLWTLPWEARCYVVLALCGLAGLANRRWMLRLVLPATALFALAWDVPAVPALVEQVAGHGIAYTLALADRLWPAFALGILAYELRDRIVLSWWALALLVAVTLAGQPLLWPGLAGHLRTIAIGYAALCVGFLTVRNGPAISARIPDYSYGMYIYAFPAMVAAIALLPGINVYLLMLVNVALTVPLAAMSWHWVEKPALDRLRRRQRTAFRSAPPAEHPGGATA